VPSRYGHSSALPQLNLFVGTGRSLVVGNWFWCLPKKGGTRNRYCRCLQLLLLNGCKKRNFGRFGKATRFNSIIKAMSRHLLPMNR